MYNLFDNELTEYIKEDLPYLDLTTHLQGEVHKKARLEIFTREDITVSCSEEAARIAELLGCKVEGFIPSSRIAGNGDTILSFTGDYNKVHAAWRLSQIMLEYSCKISTTTANMVEAIKNENPDCELFSTRKSFPFAKRFCIKAVVAGGATPHRLGLSETILLFNQHRVIYENDEAFYSAIKEFKTKAPEKKIVVESEILEEAKILMEKGADVIQMDKTDLEVLLKIVEFKNANFPDVKILAVGGINIKNAKEYAATKVDGLVTSSVYLSGMANLGSKMEIIN